MEALKVTFLFWTNPRKGLVQKRALQRDVSEAETYYEAIPATAILTFILITASAEDEDSGLFGDTVSSREPSVVSLVGADPDFFGLTWLTSFLTASIGLAKALKTGPCKILPEGRLLSCRFLLLIFATFLTLIGKWIQVPFMVFLFIYR